MKRKFLALFLVAYLMAFSAPFVAGAADTTSTDTTWSSDGVCKSDTYLTITDPDSPLSQDASYQAFASDYEKKISGYYSSDFCGIENTNTHLMEKGDCSAGGSIVTEITEPVAPNVTLDADTKVVSVYHGICCFAPYTDTTTGQITCDGVRNIYADSYSNCTANAVNCQERQWLIAKSGTGLLKLFVKQIYTWGAFSVGAIAVGTIIFQGIKISISGVSGDISDAKTKILQAIGGIVLLFLSSLILYTINPDFFS